MDKEIKEVGDMATIEDEEEIAIEEDYTALEAETIIIDDDSNIQTEAEYEQAVGQKELADEAREALSAVLLSVLEKGEINDDDIATIAAQQEIYTENVTALKILGLETGDEKSTTNVITSNIDYNELMKVLSEKADWLYIDEDGQVMLNGEVVPKLKVVELEAEKIKADVGEFKDLTTENFTATNATIENLKANKADIEYLNANYATIENLNATNANITNLQATKANIIDLNAANANIANLQAIKANITDLDAAKADINVLNSDVANIQTLVNGNLTSDNIQSMIITGDKFTVANGFIKNAMIDSVSANKINAGIINTNNVSIQSDDGSMLLQGNLQQFKDKNGKVRIQIGKDAKGNFTFCLYDENGTGQLINEKGIQSSNAIADGLIVDAKVAENANIAGSKLDIDSVVTEVNNGSTSIKGTRIYLDGQKQSLDVAFNKMTTTVKGNTDTIKTHTTSINAMDGKVTQLISDTTITKQDGTTTSLKDAYNATVDTVNSHSTKIGSLETNLSTANNNISSVSSKQAALEQNLNGFKQTVSNTYTTKADFNGLQVGGTNLQRYSSPYLLRNKTVADCWTAGRGLLTHNSEPTMGTDCYWLNISSTKDNSYTQLKTNYKTFKIEEGKKYSYSIDYSIGTNSAGIRLMVFNYNDSKSAELFSDRKNTTGQTYRRHKEGVWTATWTGEAYLCIYNTGFINKANGDSNLLFDNIKFEKGSIPTSWSPAPQDIDNAIDVVDGKFVNYSTTSDMNSAINQKANEITSTVSETYATKASVTDVSNNLKNNYSTTSAMNSAINQKADSILSTVSNTYATTQSTSTLLKESVTEYYLSTSNTTLSGGAWGTTSYTPTPGKYIWQRTKSVTNAGDIKYSNPICVSDEMYTVILKNEVLLLKCNSDGEVI